MSKPPTKHMLTHYSTLGVARGATHEEIHAAFLALSRQHHPDIGGDHEQFAAITEAWGILKDDQRRKQYDAYLSLVSPNCVKCKGKGRIKQTISYTRYRYLTCAACGGSGVKNN